ncbi:MAG TPA: peptide deformylase, partial [Bacillota bacterium]
MAEAEIRKFDDPVLREKAKPVRRVNAAVRKVLDQMSETLYAAKGIGLAAPQIGLDKAMVVIDVGDGLIELVNPRIVQAEGTATAVEGCLSLPGMSGEVPRAEKVKVEALDGSGHRKWIEGEGILARCLQHEIDHLDGILFIDKATS